MDYDRKFMYEYYVLYKRVESYKRIYNDFFTVVTLNILI